MANEVELDSLDLRYEGFRLKAPAAEERLLGLLAQRGIEQPLEGVDLPAAQAGAQARRVLLNGFKRLRCARKLRLATVPYSSLGQDEVAAIVGLLRTSNDRSLSILEQAAFIDKLSNARQLSVADIAAALSRSKAWVSVRLGLLAQMSEPVRRQLFAGAFPVYAYMYVLRPFMRLNGEGTKQVEEFVEAVSGKGLSVREIEQLAHGFFRGPESFREEIRKGNLALPLARLLSLSRNTVRAIIAQEGAAPPPHPRADKLPLDEALLRRLYQDCQGWVARVHEKLVEEEGVAVSYSTLTRRLRELGISHPPQVRCQQVPDQPGAEMQHDTSPYQVELAGRRTRLIASLIYLRYSKRRYLKFYRGFDRFKMKCFFHEALMFWGYSAPLCIIDNTNLARLRGTGANAVIVPEMEAFAKQYGFAYRCHERDHCDRKAGEERSFWFVETNFFPGRTFQNVEDLNRQAFEWSTTRLDNKPQGKAGLIPAQAFEHERTYLLHLPAHLPAPYKVHDRGTDQYGYVAFGANYYWVPGTRRDEVKVLEYSDRLKIFQAGQCLAEYPLPADGVRSAKFSPQGLPAPPHHPHNRHHPTELEEKHLRALNPAVSAYLDYALPTKGLARHQFLRRLLALSRKMSVELFSQTLQRARKYRVTGLETLQNIAWLYLQQGPGQVPLAEIDAAFRQRETYQEGSLTDPPQPYQDPADHSESKVLKKYLAFDVLLVDEIGYAEVEPVQVGLFLTLLHERHKKKSTLITSNLGFAEWGSFLKNDHLTNALIDRLTENSHVINMKGCKSLRAPLTTEPCAEP